MSTIKLMTNTEIAKQRFPHLRILGDFAESKYAKVSDLQKSLMSPAELKAFEESAQRHFAESRQHGLDKSVFPFGVGGSDAGTIYSVGFNPPSHLYEHKKYFDTIYRFIKPSETDQKLFDMGHRAEPVIRKMFSEKSGLQAVDWTLQVVNPKYPHCIANIDGLVIENGEIGIYEGKCASNYWKQRDVWGAMANKLKYLILPEIDLVPVEYLLQVWFYMAIYEVDFAYICGAYTFHIDTVGYTRIPRLPKEKEEELMQECEAFVANTAAGIRPSDFDYKNKTKAIKFYKEAHTLLQKDGTILSFPKSVAVTAKKYLSLKKEVKALKKMLKDEKEAVTEAFNDKYHLAEKEADMESIEAFMAEKMYDKERGFIEEENGGQYEVSYHTVAGKLGFRKDVCQKLVDDGEISEDTFNKIYAAKKSKKICIKELGAS